MSKYEWNVTVKNRQYKVCYVNGIAGASETKGLFVDNYKIAQPVEKPFGLYRLTHEFTVNHEPIILQVYGDSCDLIMDGVYVKHKILANQKVLDWSAWIGFLVTLLSFSIPAVLGLRPLMFLIAALCALKNVMFSLSPFYKGWKKILMCVGCLAAFWVIGFLLRTY